jgi:hypothetical protein
MRIVAANLIITLVFVLAMIAGRSARAADILIEAESFADFGGWVLDPQFMDIMGSPYLLAHGMGKPVAPARTQVTFPAPGEYRLWVRTRDWVPSYHPGTFKVIVDGAEVPAVFGTQGAGWMWQDGGTVRVRPEKVAVELVDLTGFEGRCDALFFTTDAKSVPPNEPGDAMAAWRRKLAGLPETPPSAGEFDVAVVGGGISGTAAAVAAARLGCKVALIQDRPVLGGNASAEVRVHTGGQMGRAVVPEISANYDAAAGAEPHPTVRLDQRRMDVVRAEKNITPFLNWHAFRVTKQGKRIASVDAKNVATGEERRFSAAMVVDATGDGSIGGWAGAECRVGREARGEHQEPTAPETADKMVLGTSLMWGTRETDHETTFPALSWATEVSKNLAATGGDWTWEYGHYRDTIREAEEIRDHLFRAIYGAWSQAKNGPDREKNARRELSFVPWIAGKRESRRLMGDYILTENDVRAAREFPDGVATGSWSIDLHFPKEYDFRTYAQFGTVKPYPIPFRSLYSKDIENLMMAGRDISVTHTALGSTRVMNTGGQMGVAVGAAAFLAKKYGTTPRGVYEKHLEELLDIIKGRGPYREALGKGTEVPAPVSAAASEVKVGTLGPASSRCNGSYEITEIPPSLAGLPCVTVGRGPTDAPGAGYAFEADRPVTVYLAVHDRGKVDLPAGWTKTADRLRWKAGTAAHTDTIYRRDFPAGRIEIPGHAGKEGAYYGLPHMAIVKGDGNVKVTPK